MASKCKKGKFNLSDLEKWSLERFNQIYLLICDLCHPKETPCQTRSLSTWQLCCLILHWVFYMILHVGDTTFWSHVTLIQPWKFIQGQMYWGKLIVFLITYGQNVLSLWNIARLKTRWPWFALSISSKVKCHTCPKVNWKAIHNIWFAICISYKLRSYATPFMRHNPLKNPWTWFDL